MFSLEEMLPSLKTLLSAAFVMLVSPVLCEFMHPLIRDYLTSIFFRPRITCIIEDIPGPESNRIFEAATIYLRTKVSSSTRCLKVCETISQQIPIIDFVKGEEIHDSFENIELKWKLCENGETRQKFFELVFDKRFKKTVLDSYFDHIRTRSNEIQVEKKVIKHYIHHDGGEWVSVNSIHPATFEKFAMNPEQKKMLKDDLNIFLGRKEYYKEVGMAWKRGYLLYGPPGTGKSSLIVAMANYLKFDIYDFDLSSIRSDSALRRILFSMSNRSILVIKVMDCSAELEYREEEDNSKNSSSKFTQLSLLNFINEFWSSCGDEQIIVFTTNHKEKLDPALLRPGCMDVHVYMSYCTMDVFKLLASDYLNIEGDHQLYRRIEGLLKNAEVTPAEIAEEVFRSGGTDVVLRGVVEFLKQKLRQKTKAAELNELLKSADIDVEGLVKFLKQKKLENAKAAEAERLLNSGDTDVDVDVEGLVKFIKQKKIEDAMAAEAKCKNPNES